jgi:hypothetical protein
MEMILRSADDRAEEQRRQTDEEAGLRHEAVVRKSAKAQAAKWHELLERLK